MRQSVIDAFPAFTRKFEGYVNWMYLDIKGLVTIGAGNLIDPLTEAIIQLPFIHSNNGRVALRNEIISEWRKIKTNTQLAHEGYIAASHIASLMITNNAIDVLVHHKLLANEEYLKRKFDNWDNWPADGQLAVLSMAWAMSAGFTKYFPKFTQHCIEGKWEDAAGECYINSTGNPGIVPRNHANRELLLTASDVMSEDSGLDPTLIYGLE